MIDYKNMYYQLFNAVTDIQNEIDTFAHIRVSRMHPPKGGWAGNARLVLSCDGCTFASQTQNALRFA